MVENQENDKVQINLKVDKSSLAFIDRVADEHQMSRTGLMVFATLKYAKDFQRQQTENDVTEVLGNGS